MDVTAPVIDDSSGALSVRKDMGTPLWNITLVNRALATFSYSTEYYSYEGM